MNCNAEPCWTELYIDITTQPRWTAGDQVEMVDLDLGVIRRFDGSAEILDQDEFAGHQVRYGYPPEVIRGAEHDASAPLAAVTSGTEPFGQVCRSWLARMSEA
jgi:predicted RNA-binding protein associated with RNAse of E/G family